jgi:hypothetical protein
MSRLEKPPTFGDPETPGRHTQHTAFRKSIDMTNNILALRTRRNAFPLAACLVLLFAASLAAQKTDPPATQPVKGQLGAEYVDGSFGFSLRPVAGSAIYREKQLLDPGDVEIVRFVHLADRWSLTVRLTTTTRPLDAATIIQGITDNLSGRYDALNVQRGEPARIAGRDGARYAASFMADGVPWLRQQAVIQTKPTEYYALVLVTPLADEKLATHAFDGIVASFQILRTEREQERIQDALLRGTNLLIRVAEGGIDITQQLQAESYIRCIMGGKEIGFVQINEQPVTFEHRKGVHIREWGWLFNADRSISHLQQDTFMSSDLSHERWENYLYVLTPPDVNNARQLVVDIENAARQNDQLVVAFLPQPNATAKRDKVIDVQPSYASAAFMSLLPRLLDLKKTELYAFSAYKSDRRGLVLRTVQVIGPSQSIVDGRTVSTIRIEDSEGLLPPKTEIHVDSQGRLARVVAGDLEMIATTRQRVEQKFLSQVNEAHAILQKLKAQLVPPAAAPPRPPGAAQAPSQRDPTRAPSSPGSQR